MQALQLELVSRDDRIKSLEREKNVYSHFCFPLLRVFSNNVFQVLEKYIEKLKEGMASMQGNSERFTFPDLISILQDCMLKFVFIYIFIFIDLFVY